MARVVGVTQSQSAETALREVHLRDYWKIVLQGRWTLVAAFLAVTGATFAWTVLQTPIYRATAVVEVQAQARRFAPGQDVSGLGATGYGFFAEEKYQNTQIEIVRSRTVVERALKALSLDSDPRFKSLADPVGAFTGLIKVEARRDTGLIEISIEGADGREITRWVNAVADAYVERNLDRARENVRSAVVQITKLMAPLKEKAEEAESQRYELLGQTEIYNPENQQQIVKEKIQKLNAEYTDTRTQVFKLGSLLGKIQEVQAGDGNPMEIPELAKDDVLQEMSRERVRLELELTKARVSMLPGNPAYKEKESLFNTLKARIRDQIITKQRQIQRDYEMAQTNVQNLQAEIRDAEQNAYQISQATSKFSFVNTDAQTKKEMFDVINKTMQQMGLGAELIANNVSLLDHAIPPIDPVRPRKTLNLFMGALFGLCLGLGTVFFLDYLDNTVRSPEDIENLLGLSTLAVVPKQKEGEGAGSHAIREAFQSLRTSLIFSSKNRERKVVLVTSSAPQEGKSSTVAQLARTLAGAGDRVVAVDTDMRRPTLHVHFQVAREHGLTDYLAAPKGVADWAPFVKTAAPCLDVLTCGPIPPNPPELLGSERFRRLLAELRTQYDWVLVDSPPAISLADAVLLASQADMVVLVIQHNRTEREVLARSLLRFRGVQANVVGTVLNNVDVRRAGQKDYYYAGYYYYTSRDDEGAEPRKKATKGRRAGVETGAGA